MPGPRRHTQREAALGGPEALRKHRRRYGMAPSAADRTVGELGAPSPWLDADARAAWRRVVDAAPPGLLRAIDTGTVEALAVAMVRHQRWATLLQQAWQRAPVDPQEVAMIDRQTHRAAGQIAVLATTLGLSPAARSRIAPGEAASHAGDAELVEDGLSHLVVHEPDGRRWVRRLTLR
jgi:P27 family predicted phage terminase small subunit